MKSYEIRALRTLLALTRKDLADLLRVNKQTIYNWESDRTNPPFLYDVFLGKMYRLAQNRRNELCFVVDREQDFETIILTIMELSAWD